MKLFMGSRLKTFSLSACIAITLMSWGNSLQIYAKAHLANILIAHAWKKTLEEKTNHKPWHWADTWPVAKLYFPKQRKTLYVLSGSHGEALAFGPGLVEGTALPHEEGTKVIGAHRDTHFAFLKDARRGEIFLMQDRNGEWRYYRFDFSHVADTRDGPWNINTQENAVHLITCYPFDAKIPGGPLRYVAIAKPIFGGP